MTHERFVRVALSAAVAAIASLSAAPRSRADALAIDAAPNPYEVVVGHFKLPAGRTMGSTAAIDIDRDGRSVWVFERCGGTSQGLACVDSKLAPILEFDTS